MVGIKPLQPSWPPPPPPSSQDGPTLGLYLTLGLLLLVLIVVGLGARRAWQRRGEAVPLDSEDQALLRTARDALVFLIRRRIKRVGLAVVGKR
ncbi:MAG: hypothetical protein KQI62_10455 [Deltaproteobacteria bacterium]|nr:hypothetical protein [Deltaproteobacteria bacterium]